MGKFEAADRGTLFLDEVADLDPENQIKLLRVLEERSFYRLGGNKSISVDVRIVTATNRNLQEATEQGEFREDLFYRLNVAPIYIPPLRERREDIVPLIHRFLREFPAGSTDSMSKIEPEAERRMLDYPWKGNVRELRNAVERIALMEDDDTLRLEHLWFLNPRTAPASSTPTQRDNGDPSPFQLPPDGVVLDDLNKDLIQQALSLTGGNQVRAAKLLGLTRGTLRYRLEKYGLQS